MCRNLKFCKERGIREGVRNHDGEKNVADVIRTRERQWDYFLQTNNIWKGKLLNKFFLQRSACMILTILLIIFIYFSTVL